MQIKSMNGCYINHQTVLSTFDIAIKNYTVMHACRSQPYCDIIKSVMKEYA